MRLPCSFSLTCFLKQPELERRHGTVGPALGRLLVTIVQARQRARVEDHGLLGLARLVALVALGLLVHRHTVARGLGHGVDLHLLAHVGELGRAALLLGLLLRLDLLPRALGLGVVLLVDLFDSLLLGVHIVFVPVVEVVLGRVDVRRRGFLGQLRLRLLLRLGLAALRRHDAVRAAHRRQHALGERGVTRRAGREGLILLLDLRRPRHEVSLRLGLLGRVGPRLEPSDFLALLLGQQAHELLLHVRIEVGIEALVAALELGEDAAEEGRILALVDERVVHHLDGHLLLRLGPLRDEVAELRHGRISVAPFECCGQRFAGARFSARARFWRSRWR
mmetsp:Transcript_72930/g.207805  ORF Transcript_72930/g.207805 Transcript_72930/m.207805 type:complete len:335 (-) Transcript_72930:89-1093(-)